ncbi:recombinase family protein [Corynebacterium ureicelerivorans]|uniref:recombinase family protein n=1 Tax=Corynebacterium ureicelerivorans TaxID=401472 RepID=UPI00068A0D8A|nr:recombinase family protein [Corynebacterium ureicelerivorans]
MKLLREGQIYSKDSTPIVKLMLGLLGSVAEFERSIIRERQAEGLLGRRSAGRTRGAPARSLMIRLSRHTSGLMMAYRKLRLLVG